MIHYLLAADPLATFLPKYDTSTLLVQALMDRGISVDYLDLSQMNWKKSAQDYLSQLQVASVEEVNLHENPPFRLGGVRNSGIEKYDCILQRKDPPVDAAFIGHCQAFMKVSERVLQINNPHYTWRFSEHELPMLYPQFSIPTKVALCENDLISIVNGEWEQSVLKPANTYSGMGIEFFSKTTPPETLKKYWDRWGAESNRIVLQEYSEEIETIGDLRILSFDGAIIGSVLRKPKSGNRLANLHQGGSAHQWTPSLRQVEATVEISKDLSKKGLHLIGFDFIGDRISEINITCPSALRQINEVMSIHGEVKLIELIEALRKKRV